MNKRISSPISTFLTKHNSNKEIEIERKSEMKLESLEKPEMLGHRKMARMEYEARDELDDRDGEEIAEKIRAKL